MGPDGGDKQPAGEVIGTSCSLIAAHQTGFAGTNDQEDWGVLWGLAWHVPTCPIQVPECDSQVSVPCVSELCVWLAYGETGLTLCNKSNGCKFCVFFSLVGGWMGAWEKESNQGSKRGSCQAFPSSFEPLPKLGYIFIFLNLDSINTNFVQSHSFYVKNTLIRK